MRVEAPGDEPVVLRQVLPSAPRVLAPLERSTLEPGTVEAVRWAPSDDATGYAVAFVHEDGATTQGRTEDAWWELAVPSRPGAAVLRVSAENAEQTMRHSLRAIASTEQQLKVEP